MKITNQMLRDFSDDINNLLKGLEDKYLLKLHCGNISYSPTGFTAQIKAETQDYDILKEAFIHYAPMYGFKLSDFGAKITIKGKEYTFIGLELQRNKFPCKLVATDGTTIFTGMELVQQELRKGGN